MQKREYTGTWIPAHIMEDEELSYAEKFLYAEIASYRKCFVSNKTLAERMRTNERQIQRWLAHLVQKNYVIKQGFDGRKRYLQTRQKCHGRGDKSDTSDTTKMTPIDNNIDNSIDILTNVRMAKTPGNENINEAFELWNHIIGYPIKNKVQLNRRAAHNLVRSLGMDKLREALLVVAASQSDRYAPNISDFTDLQSNINKLRVWAKRNQPATQEVVI